MEFDPLTMNWKRTGTKLSHCHVSKILICFYFYSVLVINLACCDKSYL